MHVLLPEKFALIHFSQWGREKQTNWAGALTVPTADIPLQSILRKKSKRVVSTPW